MKDVRNSRSVWAGAALPIIFLLTLVLMVPSASAGDDVSALKAKMDAMKAKMDAMKDQMAELEERLDETELHTATDKISFGVELRTRADSIHYNDTRVAPAWLMGGFFTGVGNNMMTGNPWTVAEMNAMTPAAVLGFLGMMPPGFTLQDMMATNGFNGATLNYIQSMMGGLQMAGAVPDAMMYDADNDIILTNRLRLEMKAKISDNLTFGGRLAMYKVFGDSSGVKFNTGTFGDITLDGNTSSLPHGDMIHLERAYFNYKTQMGPVPVSISLGRRPATEGGPMEYRNNSMVGGSPLATIINWQFDGASLSFGLEDATGIPGAAFKFCYGVGFESDWGNSYSLTPAADVDDATFGGFIVTLFDDDNTSAVLNYAHAWDITDGFVGTMLMPFIPFEEADGTYSFTMNRGGYISRMQATTNIGDFDMLSLLFRTNTADLFADIDFFLAPSWSHTEPSAVSRNAFYKLLGQGLLSSNGNLESQDGYSIYAGAVVNLPTGGRLGIEYNWGSEYWMNMTGAEDSLIGSKLSARGQVFEGYYTQPIVGDNFFLTLGGQYYDYEYTGSGNPLGAPVKISDVNAFDSFFPVLDEVWNVYLSATVRY